jgi:hypothetical protein
LRTVTLTQRSIGITIATAALACLAGAGCTVDPVAPGAQTTRSTAAVDAGRKAGTGLGPYISPPRDFSRHLHLTAIAVTPARMLAVQSIDGACHLIEVTETGEPRPFASHFVIPAGAQAFIAVASGEAGFGIDEIYVAAGSEIWQLSSDGSVSRSVAAIPSEMGSVTGMCFDTAGSFAHELLALTASGAVYRVDASGRMVYVGDVGPGGRAPAVAPQGIAGFGGQLLVAFPTSSEVRSLNDGGTCATALHWPGVTGVHVIPEDPRAFGASGAAFFVATSTGSVYRHALGNLAGRGGQIVFTSSMRSGSGLLIPEAGGYTWRAFSSFWGAECAAAFTRRPIITTVRMDILPGDDDNVIWTNASSTPVAFLSSTGFTPAALDGADLTFAGARPVQRGNLVQRSFADLNADGVQDLILRFRPSEMQLDPGTTRLALEATTLAGERLRGSDTAFVVTP